MRSIFHQNQSRVKYSHFLFDVLLFCFQNGGGGGGGERIKRFFTRDNTFLTKTLSTQTYFCICMSLSEMMNRNKKMERNATALDFLLNIQIQRELFWLGFYVISFTIWIAE